MKQTKYIFLFENKVSSRILGCERRRKRKAKGLWFNSFEINKSNKFHPS